MIGISEPSKSWNGGKYFGGGLTPPLVWLQRRIGSEFGEENIGEVLPTDGSQQTH